MLKRYYDDISKYLKANQVLVIYGPRRVGKTTLLKNFLDKTELKYKLDSGDNIRVQQVLSSQDFELIMSYVEGYDLIAIDEAQQIPNIGMGLKIIVDQVPNIKVIATGSSSFDLSQRVGEPLTGRKDTLILYPLSQMELNLALNKFELKEKLEEYLIYGSYPNVIISATESEKIKELNNLVDSYLLKDILGLDGLKSPKILLDLLKLLAFQVGDLVSLNELATQLKINIRTVERYIDLLEKSFVIKRLGGFSRNLRKEITKKNKYYFWDLGIRNALISQFNKFDKRDDIGRLFENFVVMERIKKCSYNNIYTNLYFWRVYNGKEIDIIEDRDGRLYGFEIKWSTNKKVKAPKDWLEAYDNSEFKVINCDNYLEYIA